MGVLIYTRVGTTFTYIKPNGQCLQFGGDAKYFFTVTYCQPGIAFIPYTKLHVFAGRFSSVEMKTPLEGCFFVISAPGGSDPIRRLELCKLQCDMPTHNPGMTEHCWDTGVWPAGSGDIDRNRWQTFNDLIHHVARNDIVKYSSLRGC
jgi:hypothetical protein